MAPERIGEIVAEVESHVADTGEDPREAFGPAREYAAGFQQPVSPGARVSFWVLIALSAVCGWLPTPARASAPSPGRVSSTPATWSSRH